MWTIATDREYKKFLGYFGYSFSSVSYRCCKTPEYFTFLYVFSLNMYALICKWGSPIKRKRIFYLFHMQFEESMKIVVPFS